MKKEKENAHVTVSVKSTKTTTPYDFVKNKNKDKKLEGNISKCWSGCCWVVRLQVILIVSLYFSVCD